MLWESWGCSGRIKPWEDELEQKEEERGWRRESLTDAS